MSVEDRIEAAFVEETFRATIADVHHRRRARRLRHKSALATVLLLVGATVAGWLVVDQLRPSAANRDANCRRQWIGPAAMPPFVVGIGDREGIRVYASGSTTFYCIPGAQRQLGDDNNTSVLAGAPAGLVPDVALFSLDAGVVYAGTVPAGTDRVDFVAGDGHVWTAKLVDRYFVVSMPAATTSYNMTVTAQGDYGVAVVPGPILHPSPPPVFGADACVANTSELGAVPMLAGLGPPPSPTLKLRLVGAAPKGYEPDEVDLIAAPGIIAICRDGATAAYFKLPDTDRLTVYGLPYEGAWAVGGRVPAGATSVTVTLQDGSRVPATLAGDYWLAWDSPDQNAPRPEPTRPVSVTATTPTGPYTVRIAG